MQIAVSAENDEAPVRATRNDPSVVDTIAADPALASGEAASTVTETTRPDTVALADGRAGAVPPEEEVGLPPHAVDSPPIAMSEAA